MWPHSRMSGYAIARIWRLNLWTKLIILNDHLKFTITAMATAWCRLQLLSVLSLKRYLNSLVGQFIGNSRIITYTIRNDRDPISTWVADSLNSCCMTRGVELMTFWTRDINNSRGCNIREAHDAKYQRGTSHRWNSRSNVAIKKCEIYFCNRDVRFASKLALGEN